MNKNISELNEWATKDRGCARPCSKQAVSAGQVRKRCKRGDRRRRASRRRPPEVLQPPRPVQSVVRIPGRLFALAPSSSGAALGTLTLCHVGSFSISLTRVQLTPNAAVTSDIGLF
jgi:hypothetical protein